jgi:phage terminase large subunit GpA-like protein
MTGLREELRNTRCEALKPPPLLTLSEWAAQHARLPAGTNALPGKFEAFAYQKGWLDAITNPQVCQVVVMKSARIGYTRCLDHAVGYFIHQDPSPILMVLPRIEDCEDFSRSEILPMLTDTPVLAEITGDIKTRDANQRILKRIFRNGASVAFVGANSPAGFRRISARVVLFDEVDGFPLEAGFEGDQVSLGIKRTETYWNRRIVLGSTPTLKYQSRIEKAFAESDQRHFHVACPSCGHFQILRWENLRWDKTDDGKHLPQTAHFVCEKNGCVIEEHHKLAMIAAGKWIAEKPFTGIAGFHLWAAYSLFPNASWSNIISEFLAAHKDPILLRTFTNVTLGEPWEEKGSGRPWEELAARARQSDYQRGTVPKGALLLFLGIDCQVDRLEWVLLGIGLDHRKFVVDYGTIGKPIGEADCQRNLELLLTRTWFNYRRQTMKISLAAIDAGFETDNVLQFCRKHSRVFAVRGVAGDSTARIAKVQRERNEKRGTLLRYARNFFNIGVNVFKLQLYRDLEKDDPSASAYVAFPNNCEDRFFQELVSESRVPVKRLGMTVWKWTKPDRQANEILDATVYAIAASLKYGTHWISDEGWQKLRDEFESGEPLEQTQPSAKVVPPHRPPGVTITQPDAKKSTLASLLAGYGRK